MLLSLLFRAGSINSAFEMCEPVCTSDTDRHKMATGDGDTKAYKDT